MKGRERKAATSTDLLVCFPTRSHLTLMPKSISSPTRSSQQHHNYQHHRKKSILGGAAAQASPILWNNTKNRGTEISSEPTSPKVTCAGNIKIRHKSNPSCKNWQSVMEEIERIHKTHKQKSKKRQSWFESLGFKKETMQFLTCLRTLKFDFRCFGSVPEQTDITTDDEEDEHDDDEDSKTVFSKWFMVLQENQISKTEEKTEDSFEDDHNHAQESQPCVPPPNALLLMRCRSAPAKRLIEERENQEREHQKEKEDGVLLINKTKLGDLFMKEEEEKKLESNNLVVMRYDTDFYKLSCDIAKETWVVGDIRGFLPRSNSWKV